MLKHMPLVRFFAELERNIDGLYRDEPYFTLILGAGASRSAGIPVTSEMVKVLRILFNLRFPNLDPSLLDYDANEFSNLISALHEYSDEWDVRDFLVQCIRRGSREPNITHLVAADLACAGVFKTIVTTNYDDLALAAFWQLPVDDGYAEPHVIYDPRSVKLSKDRYGFPRSWSTWPGEEIPVVIKAHGHHTQYGMGIIEHQVRELAPFVKRAIRWRDKPKIGYLVAGYSGGWPDGVMEALRDRKITDGNRIYWIYHRQPPDLASCPPLKAVIDNSDVYFIRCDDLDYFFLKVWYFFQQSGFGGSGLLLDALELFVPPGIQELTFLPRPKRRARWWKPSRRQPKATDTRMQKRHDLGIPALRHALLPLLSKIAKWDNEQLLPYDCLPRRWRPEYDVTGVIADIGWETPELGKLHEIISPRIPWTRRNLQLLRIALAPHTDSHLSYTLLRAIDKLAAA